MKVDTHWLSIVHRGLLVLAFGIPTVFTSEKSLAWFAPLMVFYAMADGVLAIAAAARAAYSRDRWAPLLAEGMAGVSGVVVIAILPAVDIPGLTWWLTGWAALSGLGALLTARSLGNRPAPSCLPGTAAVVFLRFSVLTVGAMRAGQQEIALFSSGGAVLFTTLFLARIFRLRLTGAACPEQITR